MIVSDPFVTLLAAMSLTVALVGVAMCLTQRQDQAMFRVLACFFAAVAITELNDALAPSLAHAPTHVVLNAIWIVGAASAMPLLWLYIWKLTEPKQTWPNRVMAHAIAPGMACVIFCLVFALPDTDRRVLLTAADGTPSRMAVAFGVAFETFALFIVTVQWGAYLVFCARRLILYRARLKDVFASTEDKELRWVFAVIGVCGAYWLLGVGLLILDSGGTLDALFEIPDYILNLLVGGILLIWGLRQRRALHNVPDAADTVTQTKYAKSALTPDMATRIAAKLRRAMSQGQLHLDPNLSLWSLSKHVGVSDNYVSQVLNEEIGQNFFDFVNGYRVDEAKDRLTRTDDTILTIAYDIGFNSRSSFYTAFKKSTGQTPTAFRSGAVRSG